MAELESAPIVDLVMFAKLLLRLLMVVWFDGSQEDSYVGECALDGWRSSCTWLVWEALDNI